MLIFLKKFFNLIMQTVKTLISCKDGKNKVYANFKGSTSSVLSFHHYYFYGDEGGKGK